MTKAAIRARGLGKAYRRYERPGDRLRELFSPTRRTYHREMWVLRDVDLEIETAAVTGLVGVNGAGKSTLLKLIAGALTPTVGTVDVTGRVSSILELGTGFQPHLTGRQNVFVNALFLGIRPWEVEPRIDEVLAFAGIGDYVDQPLSTYSSGMQARLAFATLTLLDPEVLVLDEALATGDAGFAAKCKAFVRTLSRSGCTTIIAGHDLGFMGETCDRVVWIDKGFIREDGNPTRVIGAYREFLGLDDGDATSRPRHLLIRLEAADVSLGHGFILYGFEWLAPGGKSLALYPVGMETWFDQCVAAAQEVGFTPESVRAGWGPAQVLDGRGHFRMCRPDLGPGGAAFLALPVPAAPLPAPSRLRVYGYLGSSEPTALVVSVLSNGIYHEVCRLAGGDDPCVKVDGPLAAAFAPRGTVAPPFDESLIAGTPSWSSSS